MTASELIAGWFIFIGVFAIVGTLMDMLTDYCRTRKARKEMRERMAFFLEKNGAPSDWYDNDREDYNV